MEAQGENDGAVITATLPWKAGAWPPAFHPWTLPWTDCPWGGHGDQPPCEDELFLIGREPLVHVSVAPQKQGRVIQGNKEYMHWKTQKARHV